MKEIQTVLVLLIKDDQILLGKKKRGFGAGKWNGPGGKVEPNETIEQALIRETQEEVGLTPILYESRGTIEFLEFFKGEKIKTIFYLFVCNKWKGDLTESDELEPRWFPVDEIPYKLMFEDDKYWMPLVLEGKEIKAFFEFDENWNIVRKEINSI